MVSHIQNLFVHCPKMIEEKIWDGLNASQKKVAVLAAVIFGMISVAYMVYKYSGRMDISAKKLDQEQDEIQLENDQEIKPESGSKTKQDNDSEIKDKLAVVYSNAAVPQIENYHTWKPVSVNALDLRLGIFSNEAKENEIISKKAKEMGKNLEAVYTQASHISIEGFQALVEHCPHLKILNLSCAQKTGDSALNVIAGLKELEELNLASASNASDFEYLGGMSRRKGPTEHITDEGMAEILNQCQNLKSLDLSYTNITLKTLDLIGLHPKLSFVRLFNCWALKPHDISNFTEKCPHITVQKASKNNATEEFLKLENAMKPRYYLQIDMPSSGFQATLKPGLSADEEELISPSVFVD